MSTTRYVRVGIVALVVGLTVFAAGPGPASAQLPLPLPLPLALPGGGGTSISPDVTSATGAVVTIAGPTRTRLSTGTLTGASAARAASLDTASMAVLRTAGTLEAMPC